MDKIPRVKITEEQKNILKSFHENGMISTKREMGSVIRECASVASLSEEQVKAHILLPQSTEIILHDRVYTVMYN